MSLAPWFLLTFIAGAAYEVGCVFWVHYSEKDEAAPAAGWSMFNAAVTCIGIEGMIKGLPLKVAFILGFGFGTFVAVRYKRRWISALAQLSWHREQLAALRRGRAR